MKDKKVLILGGSSDIGIELIKKYLENNWHVFCHYNKNQKVLNNLQKKNKHKLSIFKANFYDNKSTQNLFNKVKNQSFDSLVNLVGYLDNVSFQKTSLKSLMKSLQINSIIPLLIQKEVLKKMTKNNFGRILHASSIGVKYGGSEFTFNYSFSKHAIEYISSYVKKLSKNNILTNALRIGVVNTKLLRRVKNKDINKRKKLIPIQRLATKHEISEMIFFLASEKNTYISGEIIPISGGE